MALFKTNEYTSIEKDLKSRNISNYEVMETNVMNDRPSAASNQYELNL